MDKNLKKSFGCALQNPVSAFAVGAMCGMIVTMLLFPFVKGITLFSHNGHHNGNENEMHSKLADKKQK